MNHQLHLSLGPVQGFVAQARRTRDFWAGSFLLSWLTGAAMLAVRKQGGRIDFPVPDEAFLAAMCGSAPVTPPVQGTLPNRFRALGAAVEPGFDAAEVALAVREVWFALAEHVWHQDLEQVLRDLGDEQYGNTRRIWLRQNHGFWEIAWVLTAAGAGSNALERRKNWRDHWPPQESGVSCMMMTAQQELSGAVRPGDPSLQKFWGAVRGSIAGGEHDLRERESLCGPAFVKRRFARHFESFRHELGLACGPVMLHGWELPRSVPSVLHVAAVPWLMKHLEHATSDESVRGRLERVLKRGAVLAGLGERYSALPGIEDALANVQLDRRLAGVDGGVFFQRTAAETGDLDDADGRLFMQGSLESLRDSAGLGEPAPFFAVLMMDGDRLGAQLATAEHQPAVAAALKGFTARVASTVARFQGFLVYAGGDDVLALLPVTQALRCARALRTDYLESFAEAARATGVEVVSTLSGAVVFSHVRRPLTATLRDVHELLDEVAKDRVGRDAIAVRVWQTGGLHLEWAQPWEIAIDADAELVIENIAERFRMQEDERFTSGFLFRMKDLAERLPLRAGDDAERRLLVSLVSAELRHSGLRLRRQDGAGGEELAHALVDQALPGYREACADGEVAVRREPWMNPGAAKLIRFLAREGRID
ncbi:MAG: type III-B CRISPR-associated protein Cas10/Cmr2 [Gammaproteobacteria bacterium]|nr:MAG: type III-B CRISPR-associated protein Cas10/Cmr2 [Gammaproteobacteria bacterium]